MLLVCLATVASCASSAPAPRRQADAEMTVRQKFAAFNRHDADTIQSIYGANAVLHSPDYPALTGNLAIAGTYRQLFAAIPDARDEIQSLDAIADKVFVQFTLTGHWGGEPGKGLQVPIMSIYIVKDGHIAEDATYYDRKAR